MEQRNGQQLIEVVAKMAAQFGAAARLKILLLIAQAPRGVEEIADKTGESVANTSQHLQRLLREKLVSVKKEKLSRIYSLRDPRIALVIETFFDIAEDLDAGFKNEAGNDLVKIESVLNDIKNKKSVLLDVRDMVEGEHNPIQLATHIPLEKLKDTAKKFAKNKTYYVVCRGRACDSAVQSVQLLKQLGLKAFRIKEGPQLINTIIENEKLT